MLTETLAYYHPIKILSIKDKDSEDKQLEKENVADISEKELIGWLKRSR